MTFSIIFLVDAKSLNINEREQKVSIHLKHLYIYIIYENVKIGHHFLKGWS